MLANLMQVRAARMVQCYVPKCRSPLEGAQRQGQSSLQVWGDGGFRPDMDTNTSGATNASIASLLHFANAYAPLLTPRTNYSQPPSSLVGATGLLPGGP